MDPSLGYHNEITIESLSICNEISLVSLWLCFMERIVSVLWNLTSLPVVMLQILQNFTGLSFAAQNLIFRSLLFTIALRQYCYCRVTVIFNKKPAKISYTSPISRKIKEISLDKLVSLSCPSLKKGFICHPLLFDRNLHTIWTCIFADYIAVKKVQFERELISAPDGGIISLDWTKQPGQTSEGRAKLRTPQNPTVYLFICHGLTGGSHETYVQELADRVKRDYGYESIVMNFRGCSGTEVKTPQLYAGSYTGDVELSIRHIQKRDPTAVLIGVGFSLGSNVITKYSGQKGKNCPFIGMVSIGNPYDFLGISRAIHRTFIGTYFYSAALSRSLIRMFSKHINVFNNAEWLDLDEIMSSKTVQEFDAAATIKQFGYATVHEYYRFGSCAQDIPYIRVPALFLTALDDPISQSEVIPYIEFASNPFTVFIATRLGGHLGWFEASWESLLPQNRWFTKPVGEFIHTIAEVYFAICSFYLNF